MFAQMQNRTRVSSFPWDDVQLFLLLYRSRTMGEAAHALGVNISTVSRRLVALEEALDATLFGRGRQGLAPTEAAERLVAAAEQTEAAIATFATSADTLEHEVEGTVRIACPPDMAEVVLLPVLREVMDTHPRLRVVLQPGEATADLVRREADLAIRTIRPTRGDLVARRILGIEWVPAVSPEVVQGLVSVEDMNGLPWIGWGPRYAQVPASRWLQAQGVEPVIQIDSLRTQIAAVKEGLGVALVPDASLEHYGLIPLGVIAGPDGWPRDDVWMVTHRMLREVPRVDVLWEALRGAFETPPSQPCLSPTDGGSK
jgi:DNA-binding transcriptional LysR family regulator